MVDSSPLGAYSCVDYGDRPFLINSDNSLCLLTANMAVRKDIFERFGGFLPALQRAGDAIGSLGPRIRHTANTCGYDRIVYPKSCGRAHVGCERMTKAYHRRWHTGHGHFYAVMRDPEWERSQLRVLGVPAMSIDKHCRMVLFGF